MKLKCKHKRRVVVVGDKNVVLHRNDGSRCDDTYLKLGPSRVETRDPMGLLFVYNAANHTTRYM